MAIQYGYIGLFLVVAILFAAVTIVLPFTLILLRIIPRKPSAAKSSPFECGMETIGKSWVQFNSRYYLYALVFLAIDVLVVFLYPWAVGARSLGTPGFVAIIALLIVITVGYIYAWRKGALEWK